MSKPSTKPPSGMRDFLPQELVRRHHVIGVVREVFERYGFVPLETPSIESLAVLTGKYGEDEKLIYRLLHRGQKLSEIIERKGAEVVGGRPCGPGPALRPHGAAGPRGGSVRRAAEVLQALPDPAGVACRSTRPGPLPRVLPVRRRHHGHRESRRGGRGMRGGVRGAAQARVLRLHDGGQSPRAAAGTDPRRGDRSGQGRHRARRRRQARQDRRGRRAGGARGSGHCGGSSEAPRRARDDGGGGRCLAHRCAARDPERGRQGCEGSRWSVRASRAGGRRRPPPAT